MTTKNTPEPPQPLPRVSTGHGYCWAAGPDGARCCQHKGHRGKHLDPYTPRREW